MKLDGIKYYLNVHSTGASYWYPNRVSDEGKGF